MSETQPLPSQSREGIDLASGHQLPQNQNHQTGLSSFALKSSETSNVNSLPAISSVVRATPGLNAIHFIDSVAKSSRPYIRIDGNLAITGQNGYGKTSYLLTIPVFYGARASEMVPKRNHDVKKSFIEYYLPNEGSALVYEYTRHDGQACSVFMYASSDSSSLNYRFLESAFTVDMVLRDGELLTPSQYTAHWTSMGLSFMSRQITAHWEYEAIITGNESLASDKSHSDRSEIERLIKRFGLGYGKRGKITGIRKILSSMVMSEGAQMSDFCEVAINDAIDTLPESGFKGANLKSISLSQEELKNLVNRFRNLIKVEVELKKKSALEESVKEIQKTRGTMSLVAENYAFLKEQIQSRIEATTTAHSRYRSDRDAFQSQANERILALQSNLASKEGEITEILRQISLVESTAQLFEHEKIEDKKLAYSNLNQVESALRAKKDELDILQNKYSDIVAQYNVLIEKAKKDHDEFEIKKRKELSIQLQRITERDQSITTSYLSQINDELNASRERLSPLDEQCAHIQNQLSVLQSRLEKYSEPVDLQESRDKIIKKSNELSDQAQRIASQIKSVRTQYTRASTQESNLKAKADKTSLKIASDLSEIERLTLLLKPAPGSLHEFLESNANGWTLSIGKAIDHSLLNRKDLSPYIEDGPDDFIYGLHIDLSKIQGVDPFEKSRLKIDIEKLEHQVRESRALLETLNLELRKTTKESKQLDEEIVELQQHYDDCNASAAELRTAIEEVQQKINSDRDSYKKLIQDQIAAVTASLIQAKQSQLALKKSIEVDRQNSRNQFEQMRSSITKERQSVEHECDQSIQNSLAQCQSKIKEYEEKKNTEIGNQGVSRSAIEQIEKAISELSIQIVLLNSYRSRLYEYEQFCLNEIPRLEKLRFTLNKSNLEKSHLQENLSHLKTEVSDTLKNFDDAISKSLKDLAEHQEEFNQIGDNPDKALTLSKRQEVKEFMRANYVAKTSVKELNGFLLSKRLEIDSLESRLKTDARGLMSLFKELGSTRAEYLERQRHIIEQDESDPVVREIRLTDYVEQCMQVLSYFDSSSESGRSDFDNEKSQPLYQLQDLSMDIRSLLGMLQTIHDFVNQFGVRLNKHLKETVVFDRIADLSVSLRSSIVQWQGFALLQSIESEILLWMSQRGIGEQFSLPPETLLHSMQSLVDNWSPDKANVTKQDLLRLVSLEGSVRDAGELKRFDHHTASKDISSTGISYLIHSCLYIALINMVRRDRSIRICWSMDELLKLDNSNIGIFNKLLNDNNIELACTFPQGDIDQLRTFKNVYKVFSAKQLMLYDGPETLVDENEEMETF